MSILREQLVRKALAALSEIADGCANAPARKTLILRFTLAYTWVGAGADPKKKWIWDDFWQHSTEPVMDRTMDSYVRATATLGALNAICRETGYSPDPQFLNHIHQLRGK